MDMARSIGRSQRLTATSKGTGQTDNSAFAELLQMPGRHRVQRMPESQFFFVRQLTRRSPGRRFPAHALHHLRVAIEKHCQYVTLEIELGRQYGVQNVHRSRVEKSADRNVAHGHCGGSVRETEENRGGGGRSGHHLEVD